MVQISQALTMIHRLTPQTDSWRALLRTVKIWLCCGMIYGLFVSLYVAMKIPTQTEAMVALSLLFICSAGLKGALIGAVIWLLFALYARVRRSFVTHSRKS